MHEGDLGIDAGETGSDEAAALLLLDDEATPSIIVEATSVKLEDVMIAIVRKQDNGSSALTTANHTLW